MWIGLLKLATATLPFMQFFMAFQIVAYVTKIRRKSAVSDRHSIGPKTKIHSEDHSFVAKEKILGNSLYTPFA
jgi:hypothetical protein